MKTGVATTLTVLFMLALVGQLYAAEAPIKIGVMFISSGPMGGYGINGQRATEMALEEINAAGGILGRKLGASFGDTKLKPEVALELAEKFVKEEKADFLMGPTSSAVAMSLSEFSRTNKKILIVTQAATDALYRPVKNGKTRHPETTVSSTAQF